MFTQPTAELDAAVALTEAAIEALAALGDDAGLAQAYELRCDQHTGFGRWGDIPIDAWNGLRAAQRAGNLTVVSSLIGALLMPFWGGAATLAAEEQQLADVEAEFGDEPLLAPQLAGCRVWLRAHQGQLDQAITYIHERAPLELEQGNPPRAAALLNGLTWCHQWSGDLEAAFESLTRAAEIRERSGETGMRSTDLADLALLHARLGRESEAVTALEQSRALGNQQDLANLIYHAAIECLLWARRGDPARSEARFDEGLHLARDVDIVFVHTDLWLVRSTALEVLGDLAGALTAARSALAAAEREGFVPPIRLARDRVAYCEAMVAEDLR
jgi:tetratricopeptide (TPR) repeat protein